MGYEFEIEKDIEIPAACRLYPDFPFNSLQVGNSFLVPWKLVSFDGDPSPKDIENWRAQIYIQAKKYREKHKEFMVATRKMEGGLRVWRLA